MRADAVGDRIAAGDPCGAAAEADDLLHETVRAVREGEVPAALQEELVTGAQQLLQQIDCPSPEPAAPDPPAEPAEPPAPAEPVEPPVEEEQEEEQEEEPRDDGDEGDDDDEDDDEERRQGQGQGKGADKGKGRGRGRG